MLKITYYTANWCKPCQTFKPVVERVAAEVGFEVNYVDIEQDPHPDVYSIPTLVFTNGGRELGRLTGAYPEPMFKKKVREFFG